jgi:hypothetical protein
MQHDGIVALYQRFLTARDRRGLQRRQTQPWLAIQHLAFQSSDYITRFLTMAQKSARVGGCNTQDVCVMRSRLSKMEGDAFSTRWHTPCKGPCFVARHHICFL